MKFATDGTTDFYRYDSMADLLEAASKHQVNKCCKEGIDWIGASIRDKDELVQKTLQVWDKGLKTMQKFAERLSKSITVDVKSRVRRTQFNDDDGDEICLDRLRSGQSFWRRSEREETQGPSEITIIFDAAANCEVQSDDFMWRGAVAVALTKLLEERGYRVELWLIAKCASTVVNRTQILGSCLKKTSDNLDVGSLAAIVSGWFFRLAYIGAELTNAANDRYPMGPGLGRAVIPVASELDRYSKDERRLFVAGVFSFNAAVSLVEAELAKLNEGTVQ